MVGILIDVNKRVSDLFDHCRLNGRQFFGCHDSIECTVVQQFRALFDPFVAQTLNIRRAYYTVFVVLAYK
jgi:hypothetical protein